MSQQYWAEALNTAKERHEALRVRLDALDAEREEIINEVVQMEQLIKSLTPLTTDNPLDKANTRLIKDAAKLNLADACRAVLATNNRYMTPIEIRNTLAASEFDLATYSNPLASIHGVLKRIAESGDIEKHEKGSTTLYKSNLPRVEARIPATTSGATEGISSVEMVARLMGKPPKTHAEKLIEMARPPKTSVEKMIDDMKLKKGFS